MKTYLQYCKNFKKEFVFGSLFKLMEAIFELFVPLVMANIIDIGIADKNKTYIFYAGLILLGLAVVGLVVAISAQYLASRASQGFGTKIRNALFTHVNTLSFAEIDHLGASSLITRINQDTHQMQHSVAMMIRLVMRTPFIIVGSIIMAFIINAKLALVFLIAAPLISIVLYIVLSLSSKFFVKNQKNVDKMTSVAKENLEGARVVRAFGKEKEENQRFDEASKKVYDTSLSAIKVSSLLNPLTTIIINIAIIAIMWFGAKLVGKGFMLQGELVAFVNYITQISLALIVLAQLTIIFTKAGASRRRVQEVFDTKPTIFYPEKSASAKETAPLFEGKNLCFKFNELAENALDDVSFTIKKGEFFGIIGGTGSGKTTLANLLARLYDVTAGELLFKGNPISEYSLDDLRKSISIVPQTAVLFSGTLRENLTWRGKVSDEEIYEALKVAQIDEFVRENGGLDMAILHGGKNLSGGQRQRLTIARSLVAHPEVVIMDDSSSALDFYTDSMLRKELKKLTSHCAVIFISQRATSVKDCKKILALDNGRAVGIGSHSELIKSCEVYKEICESQNYSAGGKK